MSGQKRDRRALPILNAKHAIWAAHGGTAVDPVEAVLADVREKIDRFGFTCIGTVAQGGPFAYTIGLTRLRHPELIVTGLSPGTAETVLSNTAELVVGGLRMSPGDRLPGILEGGYDVVIAGPCSPGGAAEEYRINVAWRVFANPGAPLQIVYPDADERFPWDPGYSMTIQPLLAPPPGDRS